MGHKLLLNLFHPSTFATYRCIFHLLVGQYRFLPSNSRDLNVEPLSQLMLKSSVAELTNISKPYQPYFSGAGLRHSARQQWPQITAILRKIPISSGLTNRSLWDTLYVGGKMQDIVSACCRTWKRQLHVWSLQANCAGLADTFDTIFIATLT